MLLQDGLLALHLLGAGALLILVAASLFAVLQQQGGDYRRLALAIAAATSVQLVSGSLLALLAGTMPLATFCQRIGLYLAIILAIEAVLWFKSHRSGSTGFPLRGSLAAAFPGLLAAVFVTLELYGA